MASVTREETLSSHLVNDKFIMDLVHRLPSDNFDKIAVQYLDIKYDALLVHKQNNPSDCIMYMFEVLRSWKNKQTMRSREVKKFLHRKLQQAGMEKGLVNLKSIDFLISDDIGREQHYIIPDLDTGNVSKELENKAICRARHAENEHDKISQQRTNIHGAKKRKDTPEASSPKDR